MLSTIIMLPTELHCQESGVRRRIYCDI